MTLDSCNQSHSRAIPTTQETSMINNWYTMDFTHFQPWYISVLRYNYYILESFKSIYRFMYVLEKYGDFGVFWGAELHRRVRCLAMDGDIPTVILSPSFDTRYSFELAFQCRRFEINLHPVSNVMHVLLKIGQSASREEAVEERKNCRSMKQY